MLVKIFLNVSIGTIKGIEMVTTGVLRNESSG